MAYPEYMDYHTAAERGLPKHSTMHKFGRQTNLTTGAATTVWSRNTAYTYLTAADYCIIASDFTTDGTSGSGALTVEVQGVLGNYTSASETITMKGFVAATTTNQYLRVFRIKVTSAGANNTNNGLIALLPDAAGNTFTAVGVPTATSNVLAQVDTNTSQTLMTQYTVPLTYTAYMTDFMLSAGLTNKTTEAELFVRPEGEVFQIKNSFVLDKSAIESSPKIPMKIEPKSDIEFRGRSSSTAGQISASYNLLLCEE